MPRSNPLYYIAPSAISITPNANGQAGDLAVYVARNTKISVLHPYIPALGYEDETYQEWSLSGKNRRLAADGVYNIYARLSKTDKGNGYIVFSKNEYILTDNTTTTVHYRDGNSRNTSPDNVSPACTVEQLQNNRTDYWWVKIGTVGAVVSGERTVELDTGILGTEQYNTGWQLEPDALPLRVVITNDKNADPPYVAWGDTITLHASLVEGWETDANYRIDHWYIARKTGNQAADIAWNAAHSGMSFATTGEITLSHIFAGIDDMGGAVAASFIIRAYGLSSENLYSSSSDSSSSGDSSGDSSSGPEIVMLAMSDITILAETVARYHLLMDTAAVSYNPTTGEYAPSEGIGIQVRAEAQDGSQSIMTQAEITAAGLELYYAVAESSSSESSSSGGGSAQRLYFSGGIATLPISAFTEHRNVNVWLVNAAGVEVSRGTVAFVSDGQADSPRTIVYSRDSLFIPVDDGEIQHGDEVMITFRSYEGGTETTTDFLKMPVIYDQDTPSAHDAAEAAINAGIVYHGPNSGYVKVLLGGPQTRYFTVKYAGVLDDSSSSSSSASTSSGGDPDLPYIMDASDWAEIPILFHYRDGSTVQKILSVYPNVSGMDVVGADALNVRLAQDSWQIPVFNPRTRNLTTGAADPIITQALADFTTRVLANKGGQESTATLVLGGITYQGSGSGYLTASLNNDGQMVTLHVIPNSTVDASSVAIVSLGYMHDGVQYGGLSIRVTPIIVEAPVSYNVAATPIFTLGTSGGMATISPGLFTFIINRTAGNVTQSLDTATKRGYYASSTPADCYVRIHYMSNGTAIYTDVLMSTIVNNTVAMTPYADSLIGVELHYVTEDGAVLTAEAEVVSDGKQGYPGCISRRHNNVLVAGFTYHNDALVTNSLSPDGMFYVDYIVVEDSSYDSGYDVYCLAASTPTFTPQIDDDLTLIATADRPAHMANYGFQQVSVNASSGWFTTLFAQNAEIRMMTGAQIVMTDSEGNVTAGVANGSRGHHFWSGAAQPADASFSVDSDGKMKAAGAHITGQSIFSGLLRKEKTEITSANLLDYVDVTPQPAPLSPILSLNLEKSGTWISFSNMGDTSLDAYISEGINSVDSISIKLPSFRGNTIYGASSKDYVRSLVGNIVMIYHGGEQDNVVVEISGELRKKDGGNAFAVGLQEGDFACLECKMDYIEIPGQEVVYWEFVTSGYSY